MLELAVDYERLDSCFLFSTSRSERLGGYDVSLGRSQERKVPAARRLRLLMGWKVLTSQDQELRATV